MFGHTSRYYAVTEAKFIAPGGREIIYKRRRFLPQAEAMPLIVNITLQDSERLDLITARTLGDPELFWRICDANNDSKKSGGTYAKMGSVVAMQRVKGINQERHVKGVI